MVRWVMTGWGSLFRNWPMLFGVVVGGFLVPWALSGRSMFAGITANDPFQTFFGAILMFGFVLATNMAYLLTKPTFRLGTRLTPAPDLLSKWQPVANRLGLALTGVSVADGSESRGMAVVGWNRLSVQVSRGFLEDTPESELDMRVACFLSERIPAASTPLINHLVLFGAVFVLLAVAWRFVPASVLLLPALVAAVGFYHGWMKRAMETIQIRSRALQGIGVSSEDFASAISASYEQVTRSGALGPFTQITSAQVNAVVSGLGHPQHSVPSRNGSGMRVILTVLGVGLALLVLSVMAAMWLASPS